MSFSDRIQKMRDAAVAQGIVAKPAPEVATASASKDVNAAVANQATGMASAISTHMNSNMNQFVPNYAEDDEVDLDKASGALTVYKNVGRVKSYFLKSGAKVVADNDFYYAKTEEEVEILEGYAKRGSIKKIDISVVEPSKE